MAFEKLTFNLAGVNVRKETMEGIEYTVVPMAMMVEGVHAGSDGPLYYSEQELSKTPAVWNARPIVVYHPQFQGNAVSAGDPIIFDKQKVGFVMNTVWDGKLRAEAWIDHAKANTVDDRIMAAIEKGEQMEVSTGVFTDKQGGEGTWNEETYIAEAVNYRPDHLALLPDKIGACSIADGGGLMVVNSSPLAANELSHSNTREQLYGSLRERFGQEIWISDVYSDFVVYEDESNNTLYRIAYSTSDTDVMLSSEMPEEVVRVTEYRTVAGAFIGNSSTKEILKPNLEVSMTKKELVDGLISNTATNWAEDDREFLMGQDEANLQKFIPVANEDGDEGEDGDGGPAPSQPAQPATNSTTQNTQAPAQPQTPQTVEEYLNNAPEGIRGPLQEMITNSANTKAGLIETITANENNTFTKEELAAMGTPQLQKIARMGGTQSNTPAPLYFGATGGPTGNTNAPTENAEEPLVPAAIEFGS